MMNYVGRYLTVAALVFCVAPLSAQDTNQQFTGSWIHYLNVTGNEPGPFLPTLLTIHRDGTMTASSSLMFGSPSMPSAPIRYSPVHSVWEKTGPNSIAVTSLFFGFDPDGRMHGYQRNRILIELGDDRDTYTGMLFLDELHCGAIGVFSCPNPLDPTAEWTPNPNMPPGGYKVIGKRLKVVPYPS